MLTLPSPFLLIHLLKVEVGVQQNDRTLVNGQVWAMVAYESTAIFAPIDGAWCVTRNSHSRYQPWVFCESWRADFEFRGGGDAGPS